MAAGSYERKEFTGGASPTYLAGAITGTPSSFTVPTGTGATFPDGSTGPFVVVIGRGTATEEKILCTSRAIDVFTINTRGYDDTTAIDHETGEDVEHVLDASTIDQANRYVNLQSAKGSVVLHDGTNAVEFTVGTDGYTIVADSTAASGWAWSNRLTTAESNITTLQGTDIVVTLTGDATGTGTITNLSDVSIEVTVVDDLHNHTIANVDGLQTALDGKQAAGSYLTTASTFGGHVSGTYNAIFVTDDSHNHIISNIDNLQTTLDAKLTSASSLNGSNINSGTVSATYIDSAITRDSEVSSSTWALYGYSSVRGTRNPYSYYTIWVTADSPNGTGGNAPRNGDIWIDI